MFKKICHIVFLFPIMLFGQMKIGQGTGFFISEDGYLATNYHVVEGKVDYGIFGVNGDMNTVHYAKLVAVDKVNDLAILKIEERIKGTIPYSFQQEVDLYSEIFMLGFPRGLEFSLNAKPAEGRLTDNQGLNGELNKYLYDIKTEQGNSGSPVFSSESGNVIAVHVAGIGGDGYKDSYNRGIKIYHLKELVKSNNLPFDMSETGSQLKGKSFKDQVNKARNYVVYIQSYEVHHNQKKYKFESLVELADQYYSEAEYPKAQYQYKQALRLFPEDQYVNSQISKIDKIFHDLSNNLLLLGEAAFSRKEYAQAVEYLENAKILSPGNSQVNHQLDVVKRAMEREFQELNEYGQTSFEKGEYEKAKVYFEKALYIFPDDSQVRNSLDETLRMIRFLKDRNSQYFDYASLNKSDYQTISEKVYDLLYQNKNVSGKYAAKLTLRRNLSGTTTYSLTGVRKSGVDFTNQIESLARSIFLKSTTKYGYEVQSEAEYNIDYDVVADQTKVTRTGNKMAAISGRERIAELVNKGPMGKYTLDLNYGEINGKEFDNSRVAKFSGTGGASNAFKSVLVPGMGVKPVTGGTQSGVRRAVFTYLLLGTAVGCKIYSNSQYKKYQSATSQSDIDTYYEEAQNAHYAFIGFTAVAGAIWIYDIAWVTSKGFKNQSKARQYKRSISLGIQPSIEAPSLTLNYKLK